MIADLILRYCEKNKITQKDFARKIGVSGYLLSVWIKQNKLPQKGENKYCCYKIAELIRCRVDEHNTYELPRPKTEPKKKFKTEPKKNPKKEPPKAVKKHKILTVNGYVPDCSKCVWQIYCGDDIVYCSKPGNLCVNARR